MPNVNLIHDSDMSIYKNCCGTKPADNNIDCGCNGGYVWMPPPPKPCDYPPPPSSYCYPPTPSCDCGDEVPMKKSSKESQICKLSKKAAVINRMIEGVEVKKKDVIIKVGDTSYNFGNIELEVEEWTAVDEAGGDSYADTVLAILKKELSLIKDKIAELAQELDEENDTVLSMGISKTVAGE